MPGYRLATPAKRDLVEVLEYLLEYADGRIALDTEAEFRSAFRTLAAYPGLGHTRPDITSKPALFATVGRYVVVYRSEADRVVVFAILHGSRDVKSILEGRIF